MSRVKHNGAAAEQPGGREGQGTPQRRDLLPLAAMGFGLTLLFSLLLGDLLASLRLTLAYCCLFYLPLLPLVARLPAGLPERFVLANAAGLSYAMAYVYLDVFLGLPLSRITFAVVTGLLYLSWLLRR